MENQIPEGWTKNGTDAWQNGLRMVWVGGDDDWYARGYNSGPTLGPFAFASVAMRAADASAKGVR